MKTRMILMNLSGRVIEERTFCCIVEMHRGKSNSVRRLSEEMLLEICERDLFKLMLFPLTLSTLRTPGLRTLVLTNNFR